MARQTKAHSHRTLGILLHPRTCLHGSEQRSFLQSKVQNGIFNIFRKVEAPPCFHSLVAFLAALKWFCSCVCFHIKSASRAHALMPLPRKTWDTCMFNKHWTLCQGPTCLLTSQRFLFFRALQGQCYAFMEEENGCPRRPSWVLLLCVLPWLCAKIKLAHRRCQYLLGKARGVGPESIGSPLD